MADGRLSLAGNVDRITQAGEILSFIYHAGVWEQVLIGVDATNPFGVDVANYCSGDGTDDFAGLTLAQARAVSLGAPLMFPKAPVSWRVASDFTATVPCIFRGGILKTDAGVLWTFDEPIQASPNQKIFDCTYLSPTEQIALNSPGTRTGVVFDDDSQQPHACPRWWGTNADAFQQAIDSVTYARGGSQFGTVLLQETDLTHPLYVGYDFTIAGADITKITRRWHDDTPADRRQSVVFKGKAELSATGDDWTDSQYMLYYSGNNQRSVDRFSNFMLDATYKCRGAFIVNTGYGSRFAGLTVKQSVKVGVDMVSCFTTDFVEPKILNARGIGIRLSGHNSSSLRNAKFTMYGHRDVFWPDPTETAIGDSSDNPIQTPVKERAALIVMNRSAPSAFSVLAMEGIYNGWPMLANKPILLRSIMFSHRCRI